MYPFEASGKNLLVQSTMTVRPVSADGGNGYARQKQILMLNLAILCQYLRKQPGKFISPLCMKTLEPPQSCHSRVK